MSLFIAVSVDPDRCRTGQPCTACSAACPVNVFERRNELATIVAANEDECILCDLCLERCPSDAITIEKLYTGQRLTGKSTKG
jgi:NAD-dependent dihydropyrimidine dehydrogenase PreA subunit